MRRVPVRFLTARTLAPTAPKPQKPSQPPTPQGPPNIPPRIWEKTEARLHTKLNHPLNTLRAAVEQHLQTSHPGVFTAHTDLSPIVTTQQCFDDLNVPPAHPSRAPSDTYYIDENTLLRTHMTAHDVSLLQSGSKGFVLTGDVYRRDTVDRTHYPVFHQMDAARLFAPGTSRDDIVADLQRTLSDLAAHLFGPAVPSRWVDATFPFTTPSFELEVLWHDEWLEVLGCGLLHRDVLRRASVPDDTDGWAFGLGLERLAMVLFGIPDIRLFWTKDKRMARQFRDGDLTTRFFNYSMYPSVKKDVSFWLDDPANFHENDMHECTRAVAGDLVENVELVDTFERDGRKSLCFRVVFRSMERSLTHAEVNALYYQLRDSIAERLPVTVR